MQQVVDLGACLPRPCERQTHWGRHQTALRVLFLLYPTLSRIAFSAFGCHDFTGGHAVLQADVSITCNSEVHDSVRLRAGFLIAAYIVGIPAFEGLSLL